MVSQLAVLLFALAVLLLSLLYFRRQRLPVLRSIPAFEELPDQTGRVTESGQTLHLSLGTGGIGGSDTVTSLAALAALSHLAEQGVAAGTPPLVTVSDPTLLPLAQNVLRQAYVRGGRGDDFRWTQVQLISPSAMAYALGAMDILGHEPVLANVMLGSFGPEVGLIARAGSDAGLVQIAGSDDLRALGVLYPATDRIVIGEELYATGPYLDRVRAKVASLIAEDITRMVIIGVVVVVAILRMVGAL
jgi:hypothetical protein